ncbi:L,D-transpeptidase [Candidatus Gottesmanbacteria bacterium]|nr:L,D-transpeptidase [Candidatus Gottesmanbacteria bacterium]
MKRFLVLNTLLVTFLLLIINYYSSNFVLPNTYLGDKKISGMNFEEVKEYINNKYSDPFLLTAQDRVYTYNFKDLGILVDYPSLKSNIFPQKTRFPYSIGYFLKSLLSKNYLSTPLNFSQDYYQFISSTIFDFNTEEDKIIVDQSNKILHFQDFDQRYVIDTQSLQKELSYNFAKNNININPKLIKVEPRVKGVATDYNQHLAWVYQKPVSIIINMPDGTSQTITISTTDLKNITTIQYIEDGDKLNIAINETEFTGLFSSLVKPIKTDPDKNISMMQFSEDLKSLLNTRFSGQESSHILAKFDYAPNTYGDKANKYIEVDISQQSMYLFDNKKMNAKYKISSGLYYPTPVGEFKILNKYVNAYSEIFNVYMPYWMAFYYGSDLGAYFGIHELPYYVSEGVKIQRPREFIGTPKTGGCIALDIGAAKEVYDFAEVGTPVYIFN